MRILRSIVGTQSLLVQSREANFAKRRSVGSEFVGDDYRRNEARRRSNFRSRRNAAALSRWGWIRISRTSPSLSTARHMSPAQAASASAAAVQLKRPPADYVRG